VWGVLEALVQRLKVTIPAEVCSNVSNDGQVAGIRQLGMRLLLLIMGETCKAVAT
jgi:hypothetical protein